MQYTFLEVVQPLCGSRPNINFMCIDPECFEINVRRTDTVVVPQNALRIICGYLVTGQKTYVSKLLLRLRLLWVLAADFTLLRFLKWDSVFAGRSSSRDCWVGVANNVAPTPTNQYRTVRPRHTKKH